MPELPQDSKKCLFHTHLADACGRWRYFSYRWLTAELNQSDRDWAPDTVRHYLSAAVKQGAVYDAGRGWYSSLSQEAVLEEVVVKSWLRPITAAFPLLDFTCWSTLHWNPWLRHLVNRPAAFLQADAMSLPAVHELLVAKGRDSRLNPTAAEIAKNPLGSDTLVLRPRLAAAPSGTGSLAAVAQVMVDAWVENKAWHLFDPAELQEATHAWLSAQRVQLSSLLRYAAARGLEPGWLGDLSIISK